MLGAVSKGIAARHEAEQRNRAWLAWHVAAMQRAKTMPKLEKLMPRTRPRRQTPEEMAVMALRWHRAVNA